MLDTFPVINFSKLLIVIKKKLLLKVLIKLHTSSVKVTHFYVSYNPNEKLEKLHSSGKNNAKRH